VFALDDRSKQYRKNAADSLLLSHGATTRVSQDYWLTMAEFWFRLAQHVEEAEAVDPSQNLKTTAKNQNIRQLRR
jgi:hypothetical protein